MALRPLSLSRSCPPLSAPAVCRTLISFPAHALLIVEERLREQQAEGVEMPVSIDLDDLALRILIAAELTRRR
jgi:hypothetical protein